MYIAVGANIGLICSQIEVQVRQEACGPPEFRVVGQVVDARLRLHVTNLLVLPSHTTAGPRP
jgi:hypothetical protein